ncbi:MAG: hypothetical protein J0M36_05630 [Caulobacterales bacterium]|nr:hypothetical protein [Caulobacterales bacterium]
MGDHDLAEGLKLAATAVASAVLVAALVITVGGSVIDRKAQTSAVETAPAQVVLVRADG